MSTYNKIDELSKSIDNLRDKYVPGSGKADTVGGEIIRALDRLLYRFYNDGDQVGEGYGIETCNGSYRYLSHKVENCPSLACWSGESKYEDSLYKLAETTVAYLLAHKELFRTDNTEDSREISEEDREEMYRWEHEDEEIDDDWYENDSEAEED